MTLLPLKIGQGFDLHRLEPGRPFWLGGVQLDWEKGPVGHSDGDVLLHALTDALLGASGLGDIGEWFPPGDDRYKGANSAELLRQVIQRLQQDGWAILNIDCTVLLELPKLSPYKDKISRQLADCCTLHPGQVSVKAKTMEKLGPIGQGEAVAAQVVALLQQT